MVQRSAGRVLLAGVAIVLMTAACEPVDNVGRDLTGDDEPTEEATHPYAEDLASFEETVGSAAREWDSRARLVEIAVRFDEESAWRDAAAVYMAPEAERQLVVAVDRDGLTEQELSLESLGFSSPPAAALELVPPLPAATVTPEAAMHAAHEALEVCDISGDAREVLYASGAPGAWDGTSWTPEPSWSVSVLAEGGGVRLRADGTVADDPCFEVP